MKIDAIDVDSSINSVKELLEQDKDLSPALRSALEVLLVLVTLLLNRTTLNNKNSGKPPSTDPNRKKSSRRGQSSRKPGGQKGRNGITLQPVADPDEVEVLTIDRRTLPKGSPYREAGHESRQVVNIDISRFVIEYGLLDYLHLLCNEREREREREREGERLLKARCSDCQNLQSGNWCDAKKRTVPGTRHLRKCDLIQQGTSNPSPELRPGKPQYPDMVQCVTCGYFDGWGRCGVELPDYTKGEYGSRIWRWCSSHIPVEPTGACSDCRHLLKRVCVISGFAVTQPDRPTSCQYFVRK